MDTSPVATASAFGTTDWAVLAAYLLIVFVVGALSARRQKTTEEYFLAGKRIPWLAAAFSIIASSFSALSYLGHPARVVRENAGMIGYAFAVIMATPFVIFVALPFYRRMNVTTAYEYLEKRFDLDVRLIASTIFILKRLFWMALVALAPSLALSVVTGLPVWACVTIIGLIATVYTALGGMSAVIWTDVIQFLTFMVGQILIVTFVCMKVDGGFSEIMRLGYLDGKASCNFSPNMWQFTFWAALISGFFIALSDLGADQLSVQRYLTTKDLKAARKSLIFNASIKIPAMLLLLSMGVALYVFYYRVHPGAFTLGEKELDKIVPFFVVHELPAGISGLVIAAIFAAAMSSFDSGLSSLVTAFTVDWYERVLARDRSDREYLVFAKILTVLVGIAITGLALILNHFGQEGIIKMSNKYLGFFGGALLGIFVLGMLTRRAKPLATAIAAVLGVATVLLISVFAKEYVHSLWYCAVSCVVTVALGYFLSLFGAPPAAKKLDGYTVIVDQEQITSE